MTTKQAAESLGLSVRQVQTLIKRGLISATWDDATRSWDVDPATYKPKGPGRPRGSTNKPKPLSLEERVKRIEEYLGL